MDGILLDRAEFLVFMDALHATAVVGVNSEELFPPGEDITETIYRGQRSLEERGLLAVRDGVHVLEVALVDLVAVVLAPEVAIMTGRNVPKVGVQLFLHYIANNVIVEQTFPEPGIHRLATIESVPVLFSRISEILPLATDLDPNQAVVLPEAAFAEAKELAEEWKTLEAVGIFKQAGFSPSLARSLVETLQHPVFSGPVAILRCAENEIVDAFSVTVVQGERSAWLIQQDTPGETPLRISPCTQSLLRDLLIQWYERLAQVPG